MIYCLIIRIKSEKNGFLGALFGFKAFSASEIARSLTGSSRIRIRVRIAAVEHPNNRNAVSHLPGTAGTAWRYSTSCIDLGGSVLEILCGILFGRASSWRSHKHRVRSRTRVRGPGLRPPGRLGMIPILPLSHRNPVDSCSPPISHTSSFMGISHPEPIKDLEEFGSNNKVNHKKSIKGIIMRKSIFLMVVPFLILSIFSAGCTSSDSSAQSSPITSSSASYK